MIAPPRMSHAEALQAVSAGRLTHHRDGYSEIPIAFFVDRIDVGQEPIPPMDLFIRDKGKFERLIAADQPVSRLAISVHDALWVKDSDLSILRQYAEKMVLDTRQGPP